MKPVRFSVLASVCASTFLAAALSASCGSDNPTTTPPAGTAGSNGTAGDNGAAGGAADSGPPIACDAGAGPDPSTMPACPTDFCPGGGAHCLPAALVSSQGGADQATVDQLANCADETQKCVPDLFIKTLGKFDLKHCRSLLDAEGRCLPLCIPQIQSQGDRLPTEGCDPGFACAPCFDPRDGKDTSACSQGCQKDIGPKEPAKTFEHCCNDIGLCVPSTLVPDAQKDNLDQNSCTDATTLCAPAELIDGTNKLAPCESTILNPPTEGRCVPDCLKSVAAQASTLKADGCLEHYLCAPCWHPVNHSDTGACTVNGDYPKTLADGGVAPVPADAAPAGG